MLPLGLEMVTLDGTGIRSVVDVLEPEELAKPKDGNYGGQ